MAAGTAETNISAGSQQHRNAPTQRSAPSAVGFRVAVYLQNGHEGLLRHFDLAELLHGQRGRGRRRAAQV
jgi:hypothetical protein